jgi:hypothetical protein
MLHDELAKLPWISSSNETHTGTHTNVRAGVRFRKIEEIVAELVTAVKCTGFLQDTKEEPVYELAARRGSNRELLKRIPSFQRGAPCGARK